MIFSNLSFQRAVLIERLVAHFEELPETQLEALATFVGIQQD